MQNIVDRVGGVVDGIAAGAVNRKIANSKDKQAMTGCSTTTIMQTFVESMIMAANTPEQQTVTVTITPDSITTVYQATLATSEDGTSYPGYCGVEVPRAAATKAKLKQRYARLFSS